MERRYEPDKHSRAYQWKCIMTAQLVLIIVLVLTLADLVLLLCNAPTFFPLSVTVCFYLTMFCRLLDLGAIGANTAIALVISAVVLAAYVVCIVLSRRKHGFLTAAAVLFGVDTSLLIGLALWGFYQASFCLIDLALHIFVLWQVFRGVLAARRLRYLPQESGETEE